MRFAFRVVVSFLLLVALTNTVYVRADHSNGWRWNEYPYGGWDHYIRYRLQSGWPGGDNGTQALMVSHGRWQWNELPGELHFPWAPMGQANRRIDVSYEDLGIPFTSFWAVTMPEHWTGDFQQIDTNIAINSQPDGEPAHTWLFWSSSTNIPWNKVDVISLVVHEFGHAVALLHTNNTSDAMYKHLNKDENARKLSDHDEESFGSMYD